MTITETDRFETFCLYYDIGNLTIITTHNVKLYSFSFLNYYEIKINIIGENVQVSSYRFFSIISS